MVNNKAFKSGFTIVEMSLALAFLSILLIAVLTLTISAGKLYVKGVTNKTINQSGRDTQDLLRRDFLSSNATYIGDVKMAGDNGSGRICLGGVTYLWNTAEALGSSTLPNLITYQASPSAVTEPIRLARVADPNAKLCIPTSVGKYTMVLSGSTVADGKYTELIGGDGVDLALYNFNVSQVAKNGYSGLYQITYTIGTNQKGTTEEVTTPGLGTRTECIPNYGSALDANFNFCAVNKFDMIVRAGGGVN